MPNAASCARLPIETCPLCGGRDFRAITTVDSHPVVRCRTCRLQFTTPQPSDAELAAIYGPHYVLAADDTPAAAVIARSKRATADHYLDLLEKVGVRAPAPLLEIGCGSGNFLLQASCRGFDITGVEYSAFACARACYTLGSVGRILTGDISVLAHESHRYAVCVLCDVIEHVRDPQAFLRDVHRLLVPGGTVLIVTPSIDSWSARLLGPRWMEFKAEHLYYYAPATIARELRAAGFDAVQFRRGVKRLSFDYVAAHFEKYPKAGIERLLRPLRAILPASWRAYPFPIVASGLVALARTPRPSS